MKIKDTRKINERISDLWQERNFQNRIDSALFKSISENDISLQNIESVLKASRDFRESLIKNNEHDITEDHALMAIMLRSYMNYVSPGNFKNPYEERMVLSSVIEHSKIFNTSDFFENPYLKRIKTEDLKEGRLQFTRKKYAPYSLMFYDAPYNVEGTSITLPSVGFFRNEFEYPCILDSGKEWISLTPYEIFTMQEHIDKAEGNVLIIGCGMGYYTYMCSLKENVKSITVIERGKELAEIFKTAVLPQFEFKDKIHLVEEDAFDFLNELPDGKFDTCFADIYDGMGNFDFYYRLKNICRRFRKMKISYLHEENFLSYAISFAILEILETYARQKKSARATFPNIPEREMRLKMYVSELLKNDEISKASDVNYYLNSKNMLKIMNKSKIEY